MANSALRKGRWNRPISPVHKFSGEFSAAVSRAGSRRDWLLKCPAIIERRLFHGRKKRHKKSPERGVGARSGRGICGLSAVGKVTGQSDRASRLARCFATRSLSKRDGFDRVIRGRNRDAIGLESAPVVWLAMVFPPTLPKQTRKRHCGRETSGAGPMW